MAKPKTAGRPKTKRHVEAEGIAHVKATFNNTIVNITDMGGNAVVWGSAGKAGFKGSKKSTPFAATVAAEQAAREALQLGVKRVHVYVQGPGSAASRPSRRSPPAASASEHPRRDADPAQRLPSAEEAPGLTRHPWRKPSRPSGGTSRSRERTEIQESTVSWPVIPDPSASSAAARGRSCS
jgi:ribosomal protein S11